MIRHTSAEFYKTNSSYKVGFSVRNSRGSDIYLAGKKHPTGRVDHEGRVYTTGSEMTEIGYVDEKGIIYMGNKRILDGTQIGYVTDSGDVYRGFSLSNERVGTTINASKNEAGAAFLLYVFDSDETEIDWDISGSDSTSNDDKINEPPSPSPDSGGCLSLLLVLLLPFIPGFIIGMIMYRFKVVLSALILMLVYLSEHYLIFAITGLVILFVSLKNKASVKMSVVQGILGGTLYQLSWWLGTGSIFVRLFRVMDYENYTYLAVNSPWLIGLFVAIVIICLNFGVPSFFPVVPTLLDSLILKAGAGTDMQMKKAYGKMHNLLFWVNTVCLLIIHLAYYTSFDGAAESMWENGAWCGFIVATWTIPVVICVLINKKILPK